MPATLQLPAPAVSQVQRELIARPKPSVERPLRTPLWISMSVGLMSTNLCLVALMVVWPSFLGRLQFDGTGDAYFGAFMVRFGLTVLAFLALTSGVFHVGTRIILRRAAQDRD